MGFLYSVKKALILCLFMILVCDFHKVPSVKSFQTCSLIKGCINTLHMRSSEAESALTEHFAAHYNSADS